MKTMNKNLIVIQNECVLFYYYFVDFAILPTKETFLRSAINIAKRTNKLNSFNYQHSDTNTNLLTSSDAFFIAFYE